MTRYFPLSAVSLVALAAGFAAPAAAETQDALAVQDQSTPVVASAEPASMNEPQAEAADSSDGSTDSAPDEAQPIVVTGSRIKRPELESVVPLAVVGSKDLLQDAQQNISDTLNELPQVAIGSTRTNSNFLTSGNGVATINLRNVGSDRTLTLVNGRRFIAGLAGTSSVDLNNIPSDFVDHVEIVTGGSSAIYGSEAIAGVVNFIMKDKYEGLGIRLQGSLTDEGDNGRYLVSVTGGHSFMDGRLNLLGNFTWDKDEGLASRNRAISDQDCGPNGECGPAYYSSYADQGRFQLLNANGAAAVFHGTSLFTFDRANELVTGFPVGYGYNRDADRMISVPIERKLASGILNFEVTPNVNYFAEATWSKVDSNSTLEPLAIQISDYGTLISLDNPFIPDEVLDAVDVVNTDGNAANDVIGINARRRSNDIFDRSNTNDRNTFRIATGFNGDLSDRFHWDISYVYGRMHDHTATEDINTERYVEALDAIRVGPGNELGVDIVCRSVEARQAGCIPLNIFGHDTVDPRAADWVKAEVPRSDDIVNQEHVLSGSISGALFNNWAGEVNVAIGAEYRKEKTKEDLDELTNTGMNSGNQLSDLKGSFDVWELFGETSVPLLTDKPFANYLGLTGAVRYSNYSTVGGVFSHNFGIEWEPVQGVRFRAMRAVANRAPNISELYSQPSETFAAVSDPCDEVTATSDNDGYGDACRAIPAIAAAINANGVFAYTLADLQGINGFISGNSDLAEEKATTKTLGVVLTPKGLPGFSATIDYYDIKVDDAIAYLGRTNSIQQCLLTGDDIFCDMVTRDGTTGFVTQVDDALQNVAGYRNRGIDVGVNYGRRLGLFANDRIDLKLNYTYLIDNDTQVLEELPSTDSAGTFGRGLSTHSALFRASYTVGVFTLGWTTNFLSGHDYLEGLTTNSELVEEQNKIDDYWLHDLQLRFDPSKKFSLYFNVDNLFDTKPQLLPGAAFGTPTGLETSPDFDVYGRRFTAGARFSF